MRSFGAESPEMTLSQAAARSNLTRASARRVLLSLVDLGYAEKDGTRFRLRPRVLDLGYAYLASLGIAHRGQYVLETLTSETQEACSLSVLDRPDIVYVARSTVPRLATMSTSIGTRLPAHATAMGRALLAGLPPVELDDYFRTSTRQRFTPRTVTSEPALRKLLTRVRSQGYAYIDGELEIGMEVIAVPVTKADGRVIAAISMYTGRISEKLMLGEYLTRLRNAAKLIAEG
jgi:IclR family pca regulon transcriptional regulator